MSKLSKNHMYTIAFFSIIIEALITYSNKIFVSHSMCWELTTSITIGMLMAIAYKIDIFEYFGFTTRIPFLGNMITGILMSRGSNYIFDLISKITQ